MTQADKGIAGRWDERYSHEQYAFGEEPNDFLVEHAEAIPEGPVLCMAEGEGRNAVFLARRGHLVTGVDISAVGLRKAAALAEKRGVAVLLEQADLTTYDIGDETWAGIVSIFAHLPSAERRDLHRRCVAGLRPGGVFLLEHYTVAQQGKGTGGPSDPDMLPTLEQLREELAGLDIEHGVELEREVIEGAFHTGLASVVQVVARKPETGS